MSTFIVFTVFAICILFAIPISVAIGISSILPNIIEPSFTASGQFIVRSMVSGLDSFPLLAVPMFILSGVIMARGKISEKIFNVFVLCFGKIKAGIPCAVIITCLFYGAISGSGPATVAAVGSMTIPIMVRLGYDKIFATSIVATAGGLGVIIPPSIPYIMFGMASGESVSKLFLAGIIPGIIVTLLLMVYAIYYCIKNGEDYEKINTEMVKLQNKGLIQVIKEGFWALLTPTIILGCIYSGIASPTEAAVISVFYALFVSLFAYKTIKIKDIVPILRESIRTFAPILFILASSVAFSRVITLMQVPQIISDWILGNISNKIIILIVINLFLLVVGMIMDTTPAILILTPILLPITTAIGIDTIHFGIIMVVNLAIGFITPPIGINLFVASSLVNIPVFKIAKYTLPLIGYFLVALLLITFIPSLSLALI